jgi:hypothetical protein
MVKKVKGKTNEPSLDAQEQLLEILNDSPHLASLAGTDFEVRSLRFGTQYLVAQEVIAINKVENANFGDIVKQFANNIPSLVKIIVLCILNDKMRIYKDGNERLGFSDEYHALYDTLMWEGNIQEFGNLFLECLQLLDISTFFQALDIVQMFRASVTMKKSQMDEQK